MAVVGPATKTALSKLGRDLQSESVLCFGPGGTLIIGMQGGIPSPFSDPATPFGTSMYLSPSYEWKF